MGSYIHLNVAHLTHPVLDFPYAYYIIPPSVNWPRPPFDCASSPLEHTWLGYVYLPLTLSFTT